jgi:hypothetical protein
MKTRFAITVFWVICISLLAGPIYTPSSGPVKLLRGNMLFDGGSLIFDVRGSNGEMIRMYRPAPKRTPDNQIVYRLVVENVEGGKPLTVDELKSLRRALNDYVEDHHGSKLLEVPLIDVKESEKQIWMTLRTAVVGVRELDAIIKQRSAAIPPKRSDPKKNRN